MLYFAYIYLPVHMGQDVLTHIINTVVWIMVDFLQTFDRYSQMLVPFPEHEI